MNEVKVQIADEVIESLLVSALEGGIDYWGEVISKDAKEGTKPKHLAEYIMLGGSLTIQDNEADETGSTELNKENVLAGLEHMANSKSYGHHFGDILSGDSDQTTGDVLVQFALFIEPLYS